MENTGESNRYTLTYRASETRQVMNWIKAGRSGCIIGLRGAGKSNFIRFLLREEVQRHYLGQNLSDFTPVLIDSLALADSTEWAIYELILNRLSRVENKLGQEMTAHYRQATRSRDPLIARRTVEHCVDILCQQPGKRLVLLFDEFDTVFESLDPALFRLLRAIRDAHKGQICYIVVVTNDLAYLRSDQALVEHFYRLVSRNVCVLGPYAVADAHWMIRHLAFQQAITLSAQDTMCLIELSGGHAGLLKAILGLLWEAQDSTLATIAPTLKNEPAVQAECQKVWDSLSENEQAALRALASGMPVSRLPLRRLERKGLVQKDPSTRSIFSPLFADFVHQQSPPATEGVIIRRSPPTVQIGGQRVENLTELELAALCYLYEHRNRVCTKDELITNVYRQQYDRMKGGVSDQALQTLISRLRAKLEPERRRSHYIVTVRGEGYKFVEPSDKADP